MYIAFNLLYIGVIVGPAADPQVGNYYIAIKVRIGGYIDQPHLTSVSDYTAQTSLRITSLGWHKYEVCSIRQDVIHHNSVECSMLLSVDKQNRNIDGTKTRMQFSIKQGYNKNFIH